VLRIVVCLVAVATVAHAGPPTFVSLDRATGATSFGAHLGLMIFEDSDSDGGQPRLKQPRLQLFGEYAITPNVGAMVSTSVIWFRHDPGSELGLGTTHVGGYGRYAIGDVELVGRASLVLPTEGFIPRSSYYEHVAVHGSLFPFLEERAVDQGAFWLHAGATARYRRGPLRAQVDTFVDVPLVDRIYADDIYYQPGTAPHGSPTRLHIGGGVAYDVEPFRFGAEVLVSGYPWAEYLFEDLESDEGTFVGLTLSVARSLGAGREAMVWFGNPLDQYIRSRWHAVGVGYQQSI
jgi:hypothetical protein